MLLPTQVEIVCRFFKSLPMNGRPASPDGDADDRMNCEAGGIVQGRGDPLLCTNDEGDYFARVEAALVAPPELALGVALVVEGAMLENALILLSAIWAICCAMKLIRSKVWELA